MSEYTEELIHQFRQAAQEYAKAKSESAYLQHYTKALLAHGMQGAAAGGASTIAAQEREALQTETYKNHLIGLRAAIEAEEVAKARMKAAEYRIEVWRTEQANQRMERKSYAA